MIRAYPFTTTEKGETQAHIDICRKCTLPSSKCNGECARYKEEAKKLKGTKRLKRNIILY